MSKNHSIEEEFRPVVGYEGRYEVSNLGRLKRVTGVVAILKPGNSPGGFKLAYLNSGNNHKAYGVHRLVATAFIENPIKKGSFVQHIDGDKSNNALVNLEIVTRGTVWSRKKAVMLNS